MHLSQHKLCTRKMELAREVKCISTFTAFTCAWWWTLTNGSDVKYVFLRCRFDLNSPLAISQRAPSNPSGQIHLASLPWTVHWPLFWHGFGSQGLERATNREYKLRVSKQKLKTLNSTNSTTLSQNLDCRKYESIQNTGVSTKSWYNAMRKAIADVSTVSPSLELIWKG